jgi:ketosteroid isomerase-like protein
MKADAKTEAMVLAVVQKWLEAYEARNLNALMSLFVPDNDVTVIGTGADEKRIGLAEIRMQLKRDFSQSTGISAELGWYLISAAGIVAWIAADCLFRVRTGDQEIKLPLRLTAILEQRADQWLISQWHVSIPDAGQSEGASWTLPA